MATSMVPGLGEETKESKLIPLKLAEHAESILYDPARARRFATPFVVGKSRQLVYGFYIIMMGRSQFIAALNEDDVAEATEENPIPLLTDDSKFGDKPNMGFITVWNYLNGISCGLTGTALMNLEDKLSIWYYVNALMIPVKSEIVAEWLYNTYLTIVDNKEKGLNVVEAIKVFIPMIRSLKPQLEDTDIYSKILKLASSISPKYRYDILYGPPSKGIIPAGSKEISESDVKRGDFALMINADTGENYNWGKVYEVKRFGPTDMPDASLIRIVHKTYRGLYVLWAYLTIGFILRGRRGKNVFI